MNERNKTSYNPERSSQELIQARATLDAFEYIKLMKIKSPDSLKLNEKNDIEINLIEGNDLVEKSCSFLNLTTPEGKLLYIIMLADAVKKKLTQ